MAKFRVWVREGAAMPNVPVPQKWKYGTHNLMCLAGAGCHSLAFGKDIKCLNGWMHAEAFPLDITGGEEQLLISLHPGNPGFFRMYLPEQTLLIWYSDVEPLHPPVSGASPVMIGDQVDGLGVSGLYDKGTEPQWG